MFYVKLEALHQLEPPAPNARGFLEIPNVRQTPVVHPCLKGCVAEDMFKSLETVYEAAGFTFVAGVISFRCSTFPPAMSNDPFSHSVRAWLLLTE